MGSWTMAVEAAPSGLATAAFADGGDDGPVATLPLGDDPDPDTLARSFVDFVGCQGSWPDDLLVIIADDARVERYASLAEATGLAGLPDPSWLPVAVARAGPALAELDPGRPTVILDARTHDVAAWAVRSTDDGVDIAARGAIRLSERLDALLMSVARAKLAVVAPDAAAAMAGRDCARSRRDVAHLARELRRARERLGGGEELVVTAGGAEVCIAQAEFVQLLTHAARGTVIDALGDENPDGACVIVIADRHDHLVDLLVTATDASVLVDDDPVAALHGAGALVRPREASAVAPSWDPDADTYDEGCRAAPQAFDDAGRSRALVPVPVETPPMIISAPGRRPRWAVPVLSTMVALASTAAAVVLVLGPRPLGELRPVEQSAPVVQQAGVDVPAAVPTVVPGGR